jgi:hypothetical protein
MCPTLTPDVVTAIREHTHAQEELRKLVSIQPFFSEGDFFAAASDSSWSIVPAPDAFAAESIACCSRVKQMDVTRGVPPAAFLALGATVSLMKDETMAVLLRESLHRVTPDDTFTMADDALDAALLVYRTSAGLGMPENLLNIVALNDLNGLSAVQVVASALLL